MRPDDQLIQALIQACDEHAELSAERGICDDISPVLKEALRFMLGESDGEDELTFRFYLEKAKAIFHKEEATRKAEFAEWEAEYDRIRDAWTEWAEAHPANRLENCCPSVDHTPDEIAFTGPCILCDTADSYWSEDDENSDYISPVLTGLTWGEVARQFDKAIKTTGDHHHCFLEGIYESPFESWPKYLHEIGVDEGIAVLRFSSGS